MKVKTLSLMAGFVIAMALSGTAMSQSFFVVSEWDGGEGIAWHQLWYNQGGEVGVPVVNVFNANIYNLNEVPFHQDDGFGGAWLPFANGVGDSYVSIGGFGVNFPTNTTNLDPNFDPYYAGQWNIGTNAGWFNSNPPNNQGAPDGDGNVFLGQFGANISGDELVGMVVDGLQITLGNGNVYSWEGGQFIFIPAPGALALLGLAGLVGSRRRRA